MPWLRRITRKTSSGRSPARYSSIAASNASISSATSGSRGRALSSSRLIATADPHLGRGTAPNWWAARGAATPGSRPRKWARGLGANQARALTQLVLHLVRGATLGDAGGAVGPDHEKNSNDSPSEMPVFWSGINPTGLIEIESGQ